MADYCSDFGVRTIFVSNAEILCLVICGSDHIVGVLSSYKRLLHCYGELFGKSILMTD
jgi:hypothetical protein